MRCPTIRLLAVLLLATAAAGGASAAVPGARPACDDLDLHALTGLRGEARRMAIAVHGPCAGAERAGLRPCAQDLRGRAAMELR